MSTVYRHIVRYLLIGFGVNLVITMVATMLATFLGWAFIFTLAIFLPGMLVGSLLGPRFGFNAPKSIYTGALVGLVTAPLFGMLISGVLDAAMTETASAQFAPSAWLWALMPALAYVLTVVVDLRKERKQAAKERA